MKNTLAELFHRTLRYQKPDAMLTKAGGKYVPISTLEMEQRVVRLNLVLQDLGIGHGDRCALLSENRWEWAVSDFAMMTAGIVSVPLYPTLPTAQLKYLLEHSESKAVFVSTQELLDKILKIRDELPHLSVIIVFDSVGDDSVKRLESLLVDDPFSDLERERYRVASHSVKPEDLASIIYTSGTTGVPKGVMLSHSNFATNVRDATLSVDTSDVALSFLPLCHVAERIADYCYFNDGATVAYAESIEAVPINMNEVKPTLAVGVPRFFEKVHGRVMAAMADAPVVRRKIFEWAVRVGKESASYRLKGEPLPLGLGFRYRMAEKLVFGKLRGRLGGRMRKFVSGAAPLGHHLAEFFYAIGLPICEGYGLTETSPLVSLNTLERMRFGTVGQIIPNVEVQIAEDGEILVRGPNVMQGYFKSEKQTAEVMDGEWFHTGDIGNLDEDGYLSIIDRKKDMFKTSGGKYIVPAPIENLLKSSRLIGTAVVIAEQRRFPSALIVPDFDSLRKWAETQGIKCSSDEELCDDSRVQEHVMHEVSRLCSDMPSYEQIKKIALLGQEFSIEAGELTPTMKVRRRAVNERYATTIDALYE